LLSGVAAIPSGEAHPGELNGIVAVTAGVPVRLITLTVPSFRLATYAARPLGSMAMPLGPLPTVTVWISLVSDVLITAILLEDEPPTRSEAPSGVTASKSGPETPGEKGVPAVKVDVAMGVTVSLVELTTYAVDPSGEKATPAGQSPTPMGDRTIHVGPVTEDTELLVGHWSLPT
jgi:hypothetical protein